MRVADIDCKLKLFSEVIAAPGCQLDALLLQHSELLPYFFVSTPTFLMKSAAPYTIYNAIKEQLVHFLKKLLQIQNRSILMFILNVCLSLRHAAASHSVGKDELLGEAEKYETALKAILDLPVFDDADNMDSILLPLKKKSLRRIYHREWFDGDNELRNFNLAALDEEVCGSVGWLACECVNGFVGGCMGG